MRFLFVYGTLKLGTVGHVVPGLLPYLDFVGDGYVKARLFDVGDYPGATPCKDCNSKVYGELLQMVEGFEKEVLMVLDGYEDYNESNPLESLFKREETEVFTKENESEKAWIYWYNQPIEGLTEIVSGIYSKE